MADLLTTGQLQDMLSVDRTTIYRMIASGRIAAIRIGKQWRFEKSQVLAMLGSRDTDARSAQVTLAPHSRWQPMIAPGSEHLGDEPNSLGRSGPAEASSTRPLQELLPLDSVQRMQDLFAELLGVMVVLTTMEGEPITRLSNPCGYFAAVAHLPGVIARCTATWRRIGSGPILEPRLELSELGLLCARGLIRHGHQLKGLVVAGGIAPEDWPPSSQQLEQIAAEVGVAPERLARHTADVYTLDAAGRARLLRSVQAIADIFTQVAQDRTRLHSKLQAIVSLAQSD
jgi:excisionase family DNA binding protein